MNVTVSGLADDRLLEADPGSVEIKVSGYRSAVNLSFARDVRAFVDLRNAIPGTQEYPVQYSLPSGLALVSVKPERIELSVDVIETRELPVVCHTLNAVRQGYNSHAPIITPSTVEVSGPRSLLDQITEAGVTVDLSERAVHYSANLPVVLLDANNQEFKHNRVRLSSALVSVHMEIAENHSSKSVYVRTALSGNVDERHIVAGVEVQPSTVKITGAYSAVSPIESLTTETIDLSPMTETFQGFVRLVTPPDISVLEGYQVEITIRIEKNLTRYTLYDIPIEVRNAPQDSRYGTIPVTVDVTLAAFPDVFLAATIDGALSIDIAAYVDLDGHAAEAVEYPLQLEVPEDFLVTSASEERIRLYASTV